MPHTIFYSWQSDTPTRTGRNFIEDALKRAIELLLRDDVAVKPAFRAEGIEIDRDTLNVPGTPPIVETIFNKIDEAAIFLGDLTFVATRIDGRPSPNPNVLIEYGWALKSLGHSRIITAMNTCHGEPEDSKLPFNMKHLRRPISYYLPDNATAGETGVERERLALEFKGAIRAILEIGQFQTEPIPFGAAKPMDGDARFRKRGEPLGINVLADTEVKLEDGPACWLRVMPSTDPGRTWTVAQLRALIQNRVMLPSNWWTSDSLNSYRSHDGTGAYNINSANSGITPTAVHIFKTGEIWAISTSTGTTQSQFMPNVEEPFADAFKLYTDFLKTSLAIQPPYRWIAGLEAVRNKRLVLHAPPERWMSGSSTGNCITDQILVDGTYDGAADARLALIPFYEQIFDDCGLSRPARIDQILVRNR